MEFILAFAMIFIAANQGGQSVQTKAHAAQICQKEFPGGVVRQSFPVLITFVNGKQTVTAYVWECMRPVTDKDRKEMKKRKPQPKKPIPKQNTTKPPTNPLKSGYIACPMGLFR